LLYAEVQPVLAIFNRKIRHKKRAAEEIRRPMGVSGSFSGSFWGKSRFSGVF
jgi:hypothetical protein